MKKMMALIVLSLMSSYAFADGGTFVVQQTLDSMKDGWIVEDTGPIYAVYDPSDGRYFEMKMEADGNVVDITPTKDGLYYSFGKNFNARVLQLAQSLPGVRTAIVPTEDPNFIGIRIDASRLTPNDFKSILDRLLGWAANSQ